MNTRSRTYPRYVALLAGLSLLAAAGLAGAQWLHSHGSSLGTGHVDGVGGLSSAPEGLPAVSWLVEFPALDFTVSVFSDVNNDGTAEALRVFQQRVGAFDLATGAVLWATPSLGITEIEGLADVDGDGEANEIIALGRGMGGGVFVIDRETGVLLFAFNDLVAAAGVRASEFNVVDFDDDGADEFVFTANVKYTPEIYAVDLSTESGSPEIAVSALRGPYLQLTHLSVGDFNGDALDNEIVVFQANYVDLKEVCSSDTVGASCDGATCLCDRDLLETIFATRTFPIEPLALDVDADGDDEVVTFHWHSTHADGFGAFDFRSYFDSEASPSIGGWLYDYSDLAPDEVRPLDPDGEIRDLDGDGALDVVATVFNASTGEIGVDGSPVEDGLDNPGGFSVGIFAAADGSLQASLDDAYAHGFVDLDADGVDELVVERTTGWSFSSAWVEGYEFECDGTCSLVLVWSAGGHRVTRFPEAYDDTGFPPRALAVVDSDGDAVDELLLWIGDSVEQVSWDGDALVVGGSLELPDEASLAGVEPGGDLAVVNDEGTVTVYDGLLAPSAELEDLPSGAVPRWFAAAMDAGDARAVPIVDGHVFISNTAPTSLADADAVLGEDVVLIQDVDGDGLADVFSTEVDDTSGAFVVHRHEFDGSGGMTPVWEWSTAEPDDFRPLIPRSLWPFTAYDFTGDGVEDLVFSIESYPDMAMFALDGGTGTTAWHAPFTLSDASYAPLALVDVTSAAGYGTTDGVPDIVRPTRTALTAWEYGATEVDASLANTAQHQNFLFGDLDGDGTPEAVMGRFFAIIDPVIEAASLLPTMSTLWSQTDLEITPASEQAMGLAEVDDVAGDDLVYISASGAVDALSGTTGEHIGGFPIFLAQGEGSDTAPSAREPLTALLLADMDGDGYDEAVVASTSGYVYGIDLSADDSGPSVQWAAFFGAPVLALSAGDVDGDGELELLLSCADGTARTVDGLGAYVEVLEPDAADCIGGQIVDVCGSSSNIERVEVRVQGGEPVEAELEDSGDWCVEAEVPLVLGVVEILATGFIGTVPATTDQQLIVSNADPDSDGFTLCGGDCDETDPTINPAAVEVCDGVDNDCDPETDEDGDGDEDGVSLCDGDCDDADPAASPELAEVCDDGIDNDCDGDADSADSDCDTGDDDDATDGDDDDSAGGETPGDCNDCDGCGMADASPSSSLGLAFLALLGVFRARRRPR